MSIHLNKNKHDSMGTTNSAKPKAGRASTTDAHIFVHSGGGGIWNRSGAFSGFFMGARRSMRALHDCICTQHLHCGISCETQIYICNGNICRDACWRRHKTDAHMRHYRDMHHCAGNDCVHVGDAAARTHCRHGGTNRSRLFIAVLCAERLRTNYITRPRAATGHNHCAHCLARWICRQSDCGPYSNQPCS